MKKRIFVGLPVVLLAFCLIFAGCNNNGDSDTWSNATSLDQLYGTWQGSLSETMTIRQLLESMGGTWVDEAQDFFGNMRVTYVINLYITLNSTSNLMNQTANMTFTFSGGNISDVWSDLKTGFFDSNFTFNDSTYTASMVNTFSATISESDSSDAGVQINQNGNRIKYPIEGDPVLEGKNIVLTKQQ